VNRLAQQARAIFAETLRRIDVAAAVQRHIHCDATTLSIGGHNIPIVELDTLLIIAVGKAAIPMHRAVESALQAASQLAVRSVVVAPEATRATIAKGICLEGAHPVPDTRSLLAADAVTELLQTATPRTAVLFLISGGASAMLERPLDPSLSLDDLAAFHRILVASGLPIAQMNALRKHLSAVKGGRLAEIAAAALLQSTLLISDVPAASPDAIGSGPSLPDTSTVQECRSLLASLDVFSALPQSVRAFFSGPLCVETPKPTNAAFARANWSVILSSDHLAQAAASAACSAGFYVEIDNTCDDWEYREAARYLLDRSAALAKDHPRTCLVSAGELSVAIPPHAGQGGRNQHFALWCAQELAQRKASATVLSAGTDGVDGLSDAAGAVCDETTVAAAHRIGIGRSVEDALQRFDSTPLLRALGADITTGPTGNNLRDLRLVLTDSSEAGTASLLPDQIA
jgi:hydroxypyruvate reductase